jgi:8-oxo-dGTP pyrophosphatase MutT (NUDIX family)
MDASRAPRIAGTGEMDGVMRLSSCRLQVTQASWHYADEHAAEIDAHWQRRSTENPAMFNGVIHLMTSAILDGANLTGGFARTDFKSFLYWREQGYPAAGTRDAFGSALITSAEGHVLLGRQRGGHLNAGLTYLPGGFIDPRDVAADGTISIDDSILREFEEETGIPASEVEVVPGYLATLTGPLLSISRELRSPLTSARLIARARDHIASAPDSELVEVVAIRAASDLDRLAMVPYAAELLKWYFTNRG